MNDAKTNASDHHIHFQNVFLTETQRREWLVANKYAHITLFASFVVFNLISVLTDRLALRHPSRRRLSSPPIDAKSIAQGAHGAAQLAHSILAVLAAAYAVSSRPSILDPTCTNPIFCFQQLPYTLLDIHAGYLFFEWAFYANHHDVLIPRFPLLFARRCLLLIAYALARVHPCTLTVATLPWYELLSAAQGAEGALDLSVAFRRPTKDKIKRLNTLVIFSCARAIGCFLIAVYSWWYLSSKGILQMEVRGSRGGLHAMYVLVWGGGLLYWRPYTCWGLG